MAHVHGNHDRLVARIRRIKGQVAAIEKDIEEANDCNQVLQTIAACRGALNGLMAEIIEGHVRYHVLDPKGRSSAEQIEAAEQLLDVVNAYLK
jgi:DNA-binding FrmR family transcriptional regulator